MGTAPSRFRRSLKRGNESSALEILQSSGFLRRFLNPNRSYGRRHNNNTAVHFAALYGMRNILRILLNDFGGKPNKKNRNNETALHLACKLLDNDAIDWMERRATCVTLLLQWRGNTLPSGEQEKIDLAAQDKNGDTALHLAASSGLEYCVNALMNAGCPIYTENKDRLTACDLAVKSGHYSIALLLETNMVFNNNVESSYGDRSYTRLCEDDESFYSFDVDSLIDINGFLMDEALDNPLAYSSSAVVLLRVNEPKIWMIPEPNRLRLVEKWAKDLNSWVQKSGIRSSPVNYSNNEDKPPDISPDSSVEDDDRICSVCMLPICTTPQPPIDIGCDHKFCSECWQTYLTNRIRNEMHPYILCPAYDCDAVVPHAIVKSSVEPAIARRYDYLNFVAFIDNCDFIKWCPARGCGLAVRLAPSESWKKANMSENNRSFVPSRSVDCGNGHFFCWDCLGEAHAPSGCIPWEYWLDRISEIDSEAVVRDMRELEELSNRLWLASNSKPCPNCKCPIQKNDGCNHLKCTKCKFEFCWFCMGSWEDHSSSTGGYFRCTRFVEVSKADEIQDTLIKEAFMKSQQKKELNRFLRCYKKFTNQEHSRKLEEVHLQTMKQKMEEFESVLLDGEETRENVRKRTRFLEDAVLELLKLRRFISGSYIYGYYLEDLGVKMATFLHMQNELEAIAESLSDMIARPYLRTPRATVVQTILYSRRKRYKFVRHLTKALIPQGSSAAKKQKRRMPEPWLANIKEGGNKPNSRINLNSADANIDSVRNDQGNRSNNSIYARLDIVVDEDRRITRTISDPQIDHYCTRGCKRRKARNGSTEKSTEHSPECERQTITKKAWGSLKIRRNKCEITDDDTSWRIEYRRESNSSLSAIYPSQDVDVNGAAALSMQQQKSDVGVTIANVILQESDVEKSAHCSKTEGNIKGERILESSIEKSIQDVTGSPPRDTGKVVEEKIDDIRSDPSEEESLPVTDEP